MPRLQQWNPASVLNAKVKIQDILYRRFNWKSYFRLLLDENKWIFLLILKKSHRSSFILIKICICTQEAFFLCKVNKSSESDIQ